MTIDKDRKTIDTSIIFVQAMNAPILQNRREEIITRSQMDVTTTPNLTMVVTIGTTTDKTASIEATPLIQSTMDMIKHPLTLEVFQEALHHLTPLVKEHPLTWKERSQATKNINPLPTHTTVHARRVLKEYDKAYLDLDRIADVKLADNINLDQRLDQTRFLERELVLVLHISHLPDLEADIDLNLLARSDHALAPDHPTITIVTDHQRVWNITTKSIYLPTMKNL
jgi:hypothetical protein